MLTKMVCTKVILAIILCLVASSCAPHPAGKTIHYPALAWELSKPPATIDRPLKITKLGALSVYDYPDSIRLLLSKKECYPTIGKFMNYGYEVSSVTYIIQEDWKSMWVEKRYIVFVKHVKKEK